MSTAWLQRSLRLWKRRERYRKERHTYWQAKLTEARERDVHPRGDLVKKRDHWSDLLSEARANIERRERQLAAKGKIPTPPMITSGQLGLSFQHVFGGKGSVYRGAWHYTAGHRAKDKQALAAEMRADHRYHASLGWGGLSYEAMIADDGTIGFGNPMSRKSAAVASSNTGMVNICCPGTTGNNLTEAQERSVRWLKQNWHTTRVPKAYRLPKTATSFGWKGHREYAGQSTACPGQMLDDYRKAWR